MKFTFEPEARPLEGYTIKRAIDRGGFGEVYYALADSGKEVALKLLQHNAEVELRGISQCLNLKHPNLITLFDVKQDSDGSQWVIMEYVSGKSLELVLSEAPRGLPVADVEKWFSQMCAGVGYLHDKGIVHRDLKPGNIFIENGAIKIGDVGLAKSITPSHRSAQTESVGTVYYMAPEVAKGKYGHEIDVYSLGVMLYEMLTGHVPFNGESTGEILMKHLTEKPDLSKVPEAFRPVVARALAKDPLQRTPSANDLANEFLAAVRGKVPAQMLGAADFVREPKPFNRPHARPEPYELTAADLIGPPQPLGPARGYPATPRKSHPFAETIGPPAVPAQRGFAARPVQPLPRRTHTGSGASEPKRWIFPVIIGALLLFMLLSSRGGTRMSFAAVATTLVGAGLVWAVYSLVAGFARASRVPPPTQSSTPGTAKVSPYATSPETVRNLSFTHRIEDLTASMTKAAIWGLTATFVVGLATGLFGEAGSFTFDPARMGLFAIVTILASWTILLPTKLMWEGSDAPQAARRLILGALGAGVGACGFWVHDSLFIDTMTATHNAFQGLLQEVGTQPLLTQSQEPTLAGYVIFFAVLFSMRRWWWRADSFRSTPFHLGSTLLTVVLGFLIPAAFAYPQDWAVAWAGAISCVVQLSSGFVPVKQRAPLLEVA